MLSEVLCARPRPPGFASPVPVDERLAVSVRPVSPPGDRTRRRCSHGYLGGAALLWQAILPCGEFRREIFRARKAGAAVRVEGSWNAAWDARPARWLHCSDSEWLLFGVCPVCGPLDGKNEEEKAVGDGDGPPTAPINPSDGGAAGGYRITGVTADGRCLFRAIAHGSCLRSGKEAPTETHQLELADDLRAQVVEELFKRRKEIEQFIEGDFDAYVKNIQQPHSWGGEPELLMASHLLKTPISVFTKDKTSGRYDKIMSYGQEYEKAGEIPIEVLFHGYGHYDLLEALPVTEKEPLRVLERNFGRNP